ncbi:MAG: hypothetical protein L0191_12195, partial [Acidobacteria bacterium]|nr:hypothetical protein [Acidobacteriota bacterium]
FAGGCSGLGEVALDVVPFERIDQEFAACFGYAEGDEVAELVVDLDQGREMLRLREAEKGVSDMDSDFLALW